MTSDDSFLTTKEAAAQAKVHPRTIIAWVRRGWLPASKLPGPRGAYRIAPADLEQVVKRYRKEENVP